MAFAVERGDQPEKGEFALASFAEVEFENADLDPEFATKFLNLIISEVIRHHESHLEPGALAPANHVTGD